MFGCACRGTWSHYFFFCPQEPVYVKRRQWLTVAAGSVPVDLLALAAEGWKSGRLDFNKTSEAELEARARCAAGGLFEMDGDEEEPDSSASGKARLKAAPMRSSKAVAAARRRTTEAGVELLLRAMKEGEAELVKLLRDSAKELAVLRRHLGAWRGLLLRSGPARREALRSVRLTRVYACLLVGSLCAAQDMSPEESAAAEEAIVREARKLRSQANGRGSVGQLARARPRCSGDGWCSSADGGCGGGCRKRVGKGKPPTTILVHEHLEKEVDAVLGGGWHWADRPLELSVTNTQAPLCLLTGWENWLAAAGKEWFKQGARLGWRMALRAQRAEQRVIDEAWVEAGLQCDKDERWRTQWRS